MLLFTMTFVHRIKVLLIYLPTYVTILFTDNVHNNEMLHTAKNLFAINGENL
jgi:hypothetical protein